MQKKEKNKCRSKLFGDQIKKCTNLTANLFTDVYKSKVFKFKLYKDPIQCRVYFLSFVSSLEIVLSQFSETYMLLMESPPIIGEEILYYAKNATCNLLHAYIDAHSQRLIDECPGDV